MVDTREQLVIDVSLGDEVTKVIPGIKAAIQGMAKDATAALEVPGAALGASLRNSLGGADVLEGLKRQFAETASEAASLASRLKQTKVDLIDSEATQRLNDYVTTIRLEGEALKLSTQEREQYLAIMRAATAVDKLGLELSAEQVDAIRKAVAERQQIQQAIAVETEITTQAQRQNADTVAEELAGRAEVMRSLREAIQLRAREEESIRKGFEASQAARAQELNRGFVRETDGSRAQELAELREAILARAAEQDSLRKNRTSLSEYLRGIRDERTLLQLDTREREVVIAQRRAEDLAIKAGIADRQRLLQLVRQEVQETQRVRASQLGVQGPDGRRVLSTAGGILASLGGTGIGSVAAQAQQGATALEGMAAAAGASAAALGPIALAGAAILGTASALGLAAKASADLDEKLRPVAARSADLAGQIAVLKGEIRELSTVTGQSQEDLAQGLSSIVQQGTASAGRAVEFLRIAADVARATGESIPASASSVDAVLDAFNLKATEARRVADQLFVGAREGETSFGRFAGAMQRAGTVSSELGIPLQETAAFLATVSRRTGNVDEAATALVNVLGKLTGTTDPTRQRLVALGVDASAAALRLKGLPAVIEEIRQKVGGRQDILADLFGGQRVAATFFAAFADTSGAERSLQNVARANGEVAESARRAATAGEEFAKAWNQVRQSLRIDETGDEIVRFGATFAKFVSDFVRDSEVLQRVSSTSLLERASPLAVLPAIFGLTHQRDVETAKAARSVRDLVDALGDLGQAGAGKQAYDTASRALEAYNAEIRKAKDRIAELLAEQQRLAQLPEGLVRAGGGRIGGEPVFVQRRRELTDDQDQELRTLQAEVARSSRELKDRVDGALAGTGFTIPVPFSILPQLKGATIQKAADDILTNAQGELSLVAGKYTLHVNPKVSFGGPDAGETFRSEKLKADLQRTLDELAVSVGPFEVSAKVRLAADEVNKATSNKNLLAFGTLDADTAARQQFIEAHTAKQAKAQQLLIDLQARSTHGIEQQRIQADAANAVIARTIQLWAEGGEKVGVLTSAFEAMKQAQAQAFDDAEIQKAYSTTIDLAGATADVLAKREELARARGDFDKADELGAAADKARAKAQQEILSREIEAQAARVRNGDIDQATADAKVRSLQDQLLLEQGITEETKRQAIGNRRIEERQALLSLQGQLLRGLDGELFRIRSTADTERQRILLKQQLTAQDVQRLILIGQIEAKESGAARQNARLEVEQTLLGLQQDVARTYQDQVSVLGRISAAEEARLVQAFRDNGASEDKIVLLRELLALKEKEAIVDLRLSESQRSAVEEARRSLGDRLSGRDAFDTGFRAGIEDMRRLFADDFTQGVKLAQDALRTFRDSGVQNLEEVLDRSKSLADGLEAIGADFLRSIRRNLLEGLFNQLGGGLAGLFGGGGIPGLSGIGARAQGGLEHGHLQPVYQAAQGFVAHSRTRLDVAEVPGLQELIAPLVRGKLPVHVDERGGMQVRVRGAQVPVELEGSVARRRRADAAIFTGGARERSSVDTRAAASTERSGGSHVSIAPGAVIVNSAPVSIQVVSKDPGRAGSDVASMMPTITKAIAADIERGTTRALRDAIRAAAR